MTSVLEVVQCCAKWILFVLQILLRELIEPHGQVRVSFLQALRPKTTLPSIDPSTHSPTHPPAHSQNVALSLPLTPLLHPIHCCVDDKHGHLTDTPPTEVALLTSLVPMCTVTMSATFPPFVKPYVCPIFHLNEFINKPSYFFSWQCKQFNAMYKPNICYYLKL